MHAHPECRKWDDRGSAVLAGGAATLSKAAARYPMPLAPSVFIRGDGAYVECPDGQRYIDTVAGLGPVILGHSNPAVNLAIYDQVDKLASSSLSTPLETEVAELLCAMIPGAECVRFGLNGKDVNEAAVRLARYVTGKRHVLYCGYAGAFTDYLITTDKTGGILPGLTNWNHQVPWRDLEAVEAVLDTQTDDLATVILEVPPEQPGVERAHTRAMIDYYKRVAHDNGALFILDEVVTGLRYAMGGAQEYYEVTADLITMSKALGNGVPIAALLGHRDLMQAFEQGKVFFSTTFGANPLGLAAAKATLQELHSRTWGRTALEYHGTKVYTALTQISETLPVRVKGNFARMVLEWENGIEGTTAAALHTLWLQETIKRGVFFGVPIFPMCAYSDQVVATITEASSGAAAVIAQALQAGTVAETLEVPVIGSVFNRFETARPQ